jgi:hypothetical protein
MKVGAAVITCNRQDFFEKCIQSIPLVDTLIVVNDGNPYPNSAYPTKVNHLIQHTVNKNVGISKNDALRYLIQDGCDMLFLIEDDMLIKRDDTFKKYIETAAKSGLWRLSFGYHGPANLNHEGKPNPREIIDYGDGIEVAFNFHSVGSFCFFHKGVVRAVGYFDEFYKNCWEHISWDTSAISQGLLPAYWWWPDVAHSDQYIGELASSEVNSVIRKTEEWTRNMNLGAHYFKRKHGHFPTQMPDTPREKVIQTLEEIQKNYSKVL